MKKQKKKNNNAENQNDKNYENKEIKNEKRSKNVGKRAFFAIFKKNKDIKIGKRKNVDQRIFSKSHQLFVKRIRRERFVIIFFRIFVLLAFLGLWELLTYTNVIDPFFISSPSRIIMQIITLAKDGMLLTHTWVTLYETLIGFAIATILGYIIAVLLWWNEKVRKIFEPYIVVLNSLPKIALGPVIILWFGAGTNAIVTMCVLICIVITTMSMLSAFLSVEEGKILLLKSMNASKIQIFFKLILPSAMPEFVSVLKINVGMSWVGSIMGEYLTSKAGLGYLIVYGGQIFKIDLVMASTFILCLLAFVMYYFVSLLEKKYNPKTKS